MINKKGEMSFGFFLSLFGFLLLVTLLLTAFNYLALKNDSSSPYMTGSVITGSAISNAPITGNAIYTGETLTLEDLNDGVHLSSGWNYFVWPSNQAEEVPIGEAFNSIIDNVHFAYDYEGLAYWFNPKGIYSDYNDDPKYSDELFDKIKPNVKYGVYLVEDSILKYEIQTNEEAKRCKYVNFDDISSDDDSYFGEEINEVCLDVGGYYPSMAYKTQIKVLYNENGCNPNAVIFSTESDLAESVMDLTDSITLGNQNEELFCNNLNNSNGNFSNSYLEFYSGVLCC